MKKTLWLFLCFLLILVSTCKKSDVKEIVIGGLFDMSGATSDVGKEYAEGVIDYIRHVNESGGINNRQIKILYKDYEYKISQAYAWYEEAKTNNILAIIGWGTGDTEALAPKVTVDKIPFISASYSDKLANAKEYPYNFIGSVSYSDQVKISLKFIKNKAGSSTPKVAFIYNDTAFGRSAFPSSNEKFAKDIGIDVAEKIIIPLSGEGAKEKLQNMEAEWGIVQETSTATLAIINALKASGVAKNLILLNWAIDETIAEKVGNTGNLKIYGAIPYGIWEDDLPGIKMLHEINAKYHPEETEKSCRYIQGYINTKILLEAIKNAGNKLTPESIKQRLEELDNFDTGASFNQVTYSSKLHKPSSSIRMYTLENGKLKASSQLLIAVEQKIWEEY